MTLTIETILGETKVIPNVAAYQVNATSVQYRVGTEFTRLPVNTIRNLSAEMTLDEVATEMTK